MRRPSLPTRRTRYSDREVPFLCGAVRRGHSALPRRSSFEVYSSSKGIPFLNHSEILKLLEPDKN